MATILGAAALLSLERLFYVWLCREPRTFAGLCVIPGTGGRIDPVLGVQLVFGVCKAVQFGVFLWWCLRFGDGRLWPLEASPAALALGGGLVAAGQWLNVAVFRRIGRVGVFYGGQLGRAVPWRAEGPFSWFRHPQYVGVVASIWGLFLVARYPAPDWFVLPLLETVYYALSIRFERYEAAAACSS
jgi:methylene-fatty-acyl-phospholipid synthase